MPIRARIALFGAGVVAVTVVLFSLLVYALAERDLVRQQDDAVSRRSSQLAGALQRGRFVIDVGPRPLFGPPFAPVDLVHGSEQFTEILDGNGTPLSSQGEIRGAAPTVPPELLQQVDAQGFAVATIRPQQIQLRVSVRRWVRADGLSGYAVAGRPLRAVEQELNGLRIFLATGAVLSLLGALAASWLVAGRALRPLDTMAQTVESIGGTRDLSRCLPGLRSRDEVSRLSDSFNDMLKRLDDAYQRLEAALAAQRRFVADASHELRTPLTTIRSNVGLLLRRHDIRLQDRLDAVKDIAAESERMSRLVQDLLTLARADAGVHLERTRMDLRAVAGEVCRQAQNLHPDRAIQLQDGQPAMVDGNADGLRQLLWILVDNAVKHTGSAGTIALRVAADDGQVALTVTDDGEGIPEPDLERVFERFYRADPARSDGGTGLGLSIAQWIAREHAGRVTASNNPNLGATFRVELPLARPLDNA